MSGTAPIRTEIVSGNDGSPPRVRLTAPKNRGGQINTVMKNDGKQEAQAAANSVPRISNSRMTFGGGYNSNFKIGHRHMMTGKQLFGIQQMRKSRVLAMRNNDDALSNESDRDSGESQSAGDSDTESAAEELTS